MSRHQSEALDTWPKGAFVHHPTFTVARNDAGCLQLKTNLTNLDLGELTGHF